MREWAHKYQDQGLSVIEVHTPEFGFEQDVDNVIAAAKDMRVDYPIALDSNYAVWGAFANHFWPALYIADEQGQIRYTTSARASTPCRRWLFSSCLAKRARKASIRRS